MANKQAVGFDHNGEMDPRTHKLPSPETTDQAVVTLRMALGMCIQVLLQESLGGSVPSDLKDAIREQAIHANLTATKFDARFQS